MVIRQKSRSRRYLGTRSWGAGNIKNRRGSGSRGGVGNAGRKHKFTRIVKYEKDRFHHVGFAPWRTVKAGVINLDALSRMAQGKSELELPGYKVLSAGTINAPVKVKATGFSKKAVEKIKKAGGEAIQL